MSIKDKTIVLIGPVGVGKSTISRELGKALNIPVINVDLLRHCPKTLEEINRLSMHTKNLIKKLKTQYEDNPTPELKNAIRNCEGYQKSLIFQTVYRTILPNLPNYKELGYDDNVAKYLFANFGKVAWHFYQKRFEVGLLQALDDQLSRPCILDIGGGMPVSLDKEYLALADKFTSINKPLFDKHFDLNKIGFDKILEVFSHYKNVISLDLPVLYQDEFEKANLDELNELFLASGQYDKLAKHKIDVKGLLVDGKLNQEALNQIIAAIISATNSDERQ